MWSKVLVSGAVGAAVLGAGGVALASTGGGSGTGASPAAHRHGGAVRDRLGRAVHGQLVTKGPNGFVTHEGIRGTVTAVGATSITVKAADGTVETYVVTASTVVHSKADGTAKGSTGHIAAVQVGDTVGVLGTGSGTLTATHVVDRTR